MSYFNLNVKSEDGYPTLEEITVAAIDQALRDSSNNQSRAARLLNISRGTLRKYMKQTDRYFFQI